MAQVAMPPRSQRDRAPSLGESDYSTPSASSSQTSLPNAHITAIKYAHQAEKLSHLPQDEGGTNDSHVAVKAEFVTPQDPIIITADGGRLPAVPLEEAHKLNQLKAELEAGFEDVAQEEIDREWSEKNDSNTLRDGGLRPPSAFSSGRSIPRVKGSIQKSAEGTLRKSMPPFRTNPLFPTLPLYGPPSTMRNIQCGIFRATSAVLSLAFLGVIVLGSLFTTIPVQIQRMWKRLNFQDPDASRPFYDEEKRRAVIRQERDEEWVRKQSRQASHSSPTVDDVDEEDEAAGDGFIPTEGGPDPVICDVGYYARRVGLDIEKFKVQTEDGFLIDLWHVYDPRSYTSLPECERAARGPEVFDSFPSSRPPHTDKDGKRKYPVLLIHGLMQSAGAYCVNDDDSLAFFLAKSGYDVWLGNNRCGFEPQHTLLEPSDPRMWAWNIRQMGVMDLPALISRVLHHTRFPKLGLVCHSQGTTQTFVALAKEQRPELGEKISVFCALAPAAYAGPLIGKMYFKFMRTISPGAFRVWFGIHSFIPFMMTMHKHLPGGVYGKMGYNVFNFLFNWSDERWDRGVRDRLFRFSPVYVSAESMRWWLGRECFAKQKCILSTKEEWRAEERDDEIEEYFDRLKARNQKARNNGDVGTPGVVEHSHSGTNNAGKAESNDNATSSTDTEKPLNKPAMDVSKRKRLPKGSTAWYDDRCPPFALWVAGSDDLVDGRRLLKRLSNGREPHVKVVHSKIIEEYEHLDVVWAMDMIEQVGKEVRDVVWKTCPCREDVVVPRGCEEVPGWVFEGKESSTETGQSSSTADEREMAASPRTKKRHLFRRLFSH